jgi:hypothetical protein
LWNEEGIEGELLGTQSLLQEALERKEHDLVVTVQELEVEATASHSQTKRALQQSQERLRRLGEAKRGKTAVKSQVPMILGTANTRKTLSQGDIEKSTGCFVVMSLAWKMDTRFPQSKPWKSWRELWTFRSTSFFMMGKNHQSFLHSPNEKKVFPMDGVPLAKKRGSCIGSALCWAEWRDVTGVCF